MRPAFWILTALMAPFAWFTPASASEEDRQCPFSITDALSQAEAQLGVLYQTRGAIWMLDRTGMPPRDFLSAMEYYLEPGQFGRAEDRSGLLFYVASEEDVCVVFAQMTDTYHRYPMGEVSRVDVTMRPLALPASQLASLVDDRLQGLVQSAPVVRAPVPLSEFARQQTRGATRLSRGGPPADAASLLGDIAEALFPPEIAQALGSLSSLTIVPALNLGKVPFAALDPTAEGTILMKHAAVNVESSMRSIFERTIFAWEPTPPKNPLVVGDPDARNDPDWLLPRLPGAADEARAVAALWRRTAITGAEATPERVLEQMEEADYIHIAAHGIASIEKPMDNSFLALAGGRLTARQIQSLKLASLPIVVLSACQSALGSPLEAGIIGVARAFVIAGSIGVVASLWNVDDAATAAVMRRFAELLLETNPADALRRAQLEALERWPSPQVWAAFILYGPRIVTNGSQ